MNPRNLFVVIPAAGRSRRMGQPKLLFPLGGKTVISRLIEAFDHPKIRCKAVVARKDDETLAAEVTKAGGWVIQPDNDPPEMRESVEYALAKIAETFSPDPEDAWLLVPGDHPVLSKKVVNQLINVWSDSAAEILIPTHEGRRGHPTLLSWKLASQVVTVPADSGMNWLVRQSGASIQEVPVDEPGIFTDLDTPADYESLKKSFLSES